MVADKEGEKMIYLEVFFTFFVIGAFTFGGGYAMLPLVQEAVLHYGWLTEEQIFDFLAVSESTPGPFAVNMATYVGFKTCGFFGAALATLGVVLPSFIVILLVAKWYQKFSKSRMVEGFMSGIRPAVVGLIGGAAISIGAGLILTEGARLAGQTELIRMLPVLMIDIIMAAKKVNPIYIILASAVLGIIMGRII